MMAGIHSAQPHQPLICDMGTAAARATTVMTLFQAMSMP
jgi:hypothetical protein